MRKWHLVVCNTLLNVMQSEYGGDQSRIYLAGHGCAFPVILAAEINTTTDTATSRASLGAHVPLLHAIQRAVVISREAIFRSYASASNAGAVSSSDSTSAGKPPPVVISNGTRRVHEYGKGVWAPQAEGLLLFVCVPLSLLIL